jgi:hypothetical protein
MCAKETIGAAWNDLGDNGVNETSGYSVWKLGNFLPSLDTAFP